MLYSFVQLNATRVYSSIRERKNVKELMTGKRGMNNLYLKYKGKISREQL